MGDRWTTYKLSLSYFLFLIHVLVQGCSSLNLEGLALLDFRAGVSHDPYGAFRSWQEYNHDPCSWSNVHCVDGNVHVLDLNGLSLEGVLVPEIGNLTQLRCLVLSQNKFSGVIPKELGELTLLEVLDLRDNNLSGRIPLELGRMHSLKRFIWQGGSKLQKKADSLLKQVKETFSCYLNPFQLFRIRKSFSNDCNSSEKAVGALEAEMVDNVVRRKLAEESLNLAAAPSPSDVIGPLNIIALPTTRSSGSFPAVPKYIKKQNPSPPPPPPHQMPANQAPESESEESSKLDKWKIWVILFFGILLLIIIAIALWCVCQSRAVKTMGPWKTGISGQLQKAFVTGVPKLNRTELETACEDFSNIIETKEGYTIYKGTLSSGVEICVASTPISSLKDWSKRAELGFHKKIDALSRVNHKNFINLLGYCEEDEPFVRMMVFEYATNGSLSEHLHVKELEHLDWSSRMRIIMGTSYCLEYMHELNPPVPHTNVTSTMIYLNEDYAPKVAEVAFWRNSISKAKVSAESESENSALLPLVDTETNVYCFGILMLEIISGKLPHSDQHGHFEDWAAQCLQDKRNSSYMVDPTLKSFNENELDIICEVIEECIQQDAQKRPTMKEVVTKLREVLRISPEQAIQRQSPLWWAELEILSGEA